MAEVWKVGSHSLMGHGVLMLCLGIALSVLGSIMANPIHGDFGYALAAVLTAFCLLIAGAYLGVLEYRVRLRRTVSIYVLVGASSIACWLIFWLVQSASADIRLLLLIAGLHGLFWGLWYLRLAFYFQSYSGKAVMLSVLAATTSSLGIILATQSELSKLSAVTVVACYMTFIGIQILLTAALLYRECEIERRALADVSADETEIELLAELRANELEREAVAD